jgi:hypothetical protein
MASISEDFNGFVTVDLDSNLTPQPWPSVPAGSPSLRHVSGQVALRGNFGTRNRHPTPLDSIDQRASVEYVAFNSAADLEFAGPAVRMNATTATYYNLVSDSTIVGIEKYVNGVYIEAFATYVSRAIAPGDRLELRVTGTNPVLLSAYHNGSLITGLGTVGTVSDAAPDRIVAGNYVGLFGLSFTATEQLRMDNLQAQDLAADGVIGAMAVSESGSDVLAASGGLASNGIRLTLRDTDTGALAASFSGLIVSVRAASDAESTLVEGILSTNAGGVLELANGALGNPGDYVYATIEMADHSIVATYRVQVIDLNA